MTLKRFWTIVVRVAQLLAVVAVFGFIGSLLLIPKQGEWCTYLGVERVFMHEPGQYSLLVRGEQGVLSSIDLRGNHNAKANIFTDVPPDQPMYARVLHSPEGRCGGNIRPWYTELHVHTVQEINPAGWNHGKLGRGQTIEIE